jgi:hypothetical protein
VDCGARLPGRRRCSIRTGCSVHRIERDWRGRIPISVLLVVAALFPLGARAQLTTSVSATGQYQYNSNVFDLQRGYGGLHDLSDHYFAYGAGLDLNEQISQQNIYLRGTDTEYDYDRFSTLTHNEYNADAGWLWKVGQEANGSIDVTRARTMVPFTEIVSVVMSLEIDQRESASAGFLITPEWRIDFNGYKDEVQEPLPAEGQPNLEFNNSGGGVLLSFLGAGEWVANANVIYQRGDYSGASLAPTGRSGLLHTLFLQHLNASTTPPVADAYGFFGPAFTQWTESIGATYSPAGQGAGVSTFDFAIGRTARSSPYGVDDDSGTTGHLDYNRQLTGKTSVSLALDRDILNYIAGAGGDISSSASLTGIWKATFKTSFDVGYNLVYARLLGQGLAATTRGDHLQFATLTINYTALPWLAISPYADYQTRRSNFYGANFNASIFGVSVLIEWPRVTGQAPQPVTTLGTAY